MKSVLEFNLPEDQVEFETAANSGKWKSAVKDMDQWLRDKIKYAPDSMSEDKYNTYIVCRKQLREILEEENLNLD